MKFWKKFFEIKKRKFEEIILKMREIKKNCGNFEKTYIIKKIDPLFFKFDEILKTSWQNFENNIQPNFFLIGRNFENVLMKLLKNFENILTKLWEKACWHFGRNLAKWEKVKEVLKNLMKFWEKFDKIKKENLMKLLKKWKKF